ncbi:Gfo/Idh/MocA family oxidoreductase [Crenobacter sp. SG2303]|uniref:Gfo/Idh/MocA family oxidoreductase n=1 Tax=Crenobacter oryzisoli TaxID=3056844 RepID=A0ABT7XRS4_9NEIS|nr:Gfo/Idh/MocA family oxidoreductase [Crenobacter sp. SG2303]MDN0076501.1 Gfo/Idh/MocA family oxidoreductase [Crenobacter sp. SG2303]
MQKKLRVGVLGAGLIAQLEHIPNILKLSGLYQLVGIADASATVREFFKDRNLPVFESHQKLLSQAEPEVVFVCSPDCYHADMVIDALNAGCHVFTEKPICYSLEDVARIKQARDANGKIVQVGYMKRFDPSYQLLHDMLPDDGAKLRMVSVEVCDPDSWPFREHQGELVFANDISPAMRDDFKARQNAQIAQALNGQPDENSYRGFAGAFCSSLVHDINVVHGLLQKMNVDTEWIEGASFFANGDGGQASVRLNTQTALWQMMHLTVPQVAEYHERITLYFDDAVYHLEFPSPYLNHFPARLTVWKSDGMHSQKTEHRANYKEAFVEELKYLWETIVNHSQPLNTLEDAERDTRLLVAMGRAALTNETRAI